MENTELRRLLGQVEAQYRVGKYITSWLGELHSCSPVVFDSFNLADDTRELRAQCHRLEGLIAIIEQNLSESAAENRQEQCVVYANELMRRFTSKNPASRNDNIMRVANLMGRQDVVDIMLESVQLEAVMSV